MTTPELDRSTAEGQSQRPEQIKLPEWAEGSPEAELCAEIDGHLRNAKSGDKFEIRFSRTVTKESIDKIRPIYERSKTLPCVFFATVVGKRCTTLSIEVLES